MKLAKKLACRPHGNLTLLISGRCHSERESLVSVESHGMCGARKTFGFWIRKKRARRVRQWGSVRAVCVHVADSLKPDRELRLGSERSKRVCISIDCVEGSSF